LLAGIGKIGKAIALLFKGQFSEAGKTAMEGFGDIASGTIKMTPVGVVMETVKRRDEITGAASAGYAKGKAMDTSNFLKFGRKKEQPITAADMQIPEMDAVNLPGKLNLASPDFDMMGIPAELNMTAPDFGMMQIPAKLNMTAPGSDMYQKQFDATQKKKQYAEQLVREGKAVPEYPNIKSDWSPIPKQPLDSSYNFDQVTKNITQNIVNNQTRTQNQNQNQNSKVEVVYQPQIHISAEMTRENQESLLKMLYQHKEQVTKMVKEELRKEGRLNYAG
jgi:hypothetical protein